MTIYIIYINFKELQFDKPLIDILLIVELLWKLIPDYDRTSSMSQPPGEVLRSHADQNVTHRLLNELKISFLWRPVIDDKFLDEFKKWDIIEDEEAPFIIFLGKFVLIAYMNVYKSHTSSLYWA